MLDLLNIISSAAHCIHENANDREILPRELKIALGTHELSARSTGSIIATVPSITLHDTWNPSTVQFDGDIAVIKLSESIAFNDYIRPVCLPDDDISLIKKGETASWGKLRRFTSGFGYSQAFERSLDFPTFRLFQEGQ